MPTNLRRASRRSPAALLLASALALAGCESVRVDYDYDPDVSFDRLSTFAWRPLPGAAEADAVESPLRDKAVREAVTGELEARGFREQDAPAGPAAPAAPASAAAAPPLPAGAAGPVPDFTVSAFTVVRQRVDVSYPSYGPWGWHGYGWWHSPWYGQPWVVTWDEGTLVLDIADGRSGAPLWRGTASRAIDYDLTPEERRARLRESVRAVLAKFPPPR